MTESGLVDICQLNEAIYDRSLVPPHLIASELSAAIFILWVRGPTYDNHCLRCARESDRVTRDPGQRSRVNCDC